MQKGRLTKNNPKQINLQRTQLWLHGRAPFLLLRSRKQASLLRNPRIRKDNINPSLSCIHPLKCSSLRLPRGDVALLETYAGGRVCCAESRDGFGSAGWVYVEDCQVCVCGFGAGEVGAYAVADA